MKVLFGLSFFPTQARMFSQTAEYALRVVAYLGSLGGTPVTTRQIAAATRVPVGYLSKVLQTLSRQRLVVSQRGLHGGSVLARPAEQVTLYDVLQAVDPIQRITRCPLGLNAHGASLCPVHRRLDDTMAMVERAMRDCTIADMLGESGGSKPLCETGEAAAAGRSGAATAGAKPGTTSLTITRKRKVRGPTV